MNARPQFYLATTLAALGHLACGGSQATPVEDPLPASSAATAVATTPEATVEAPAAATADATMSATAEASAASDHAPGGIQCNELAKACHEVGHKADEAGECHKIGHAGDAAVCEKEHARCIAVCKKASASGAHGHH